MNFAAQLDHDLSVSDAEKAEDLSSKEYLSLLGDGEINPCPDQWAKLQKNPENRDCWKLHHLIGDMLRSSDLRPVSANFSLRVMSALESEPVVLAPHQATANKRRSSLNWTTVKHWALPSMAVAAAAVTVVWVAIPQITGPASSAITANNTPLPPPVSSIDSAQTLNAPLIAVSLPPPANTLSSASLDRYLIAHQQVSPTTSRHAVVLPMVRVTRISAEDR